MMLFLVQVQLAEVSFFKHLIADRKRLGIWGKNFIPQMENGYPPNLKDMQQVILKGKMNIPPKIKEAAEKVDITAYIWYNVIIQYRR